MEHEDKYTGFAAAALKLMSELTDKSVEELIESGSVIVHDDNDNIDVEIKKEAWLKNET